LQKKIESGESNMKTLIIYKSKKAATKVCGEKLMAQVKGKCKMLTFEEVQEDLIKEADQIVLGTPIYAGSVLPELKNLVSTYEALLKTKKVFLYICCMDASHKDNYMQQSFSPEHIELFEKIICVGGAFYFDKMNFMEKLIIKLIVNSDNKKKGIKKKVDVKTNIEMFDEVAISSLAKILGEA